MKYQVVVKVQPFVGAKYEECYVHDFGGEVAPHIIEAEVQYLKEKYTRDPYDDVGVSITEDKQTEEDKEAYDKKIKEIEAGENLHTHVRDKDSEISESALDNTYYLLYGAENTDYLVRVVTASKGFHLDKLSKDEDYRVRRAVANHEEYAHILAKDNDSRVRSKVAIGGFELPTLVDDGVPSVRQSALEALANKTEEEKLAYISKGQLLEQLAYDDSISVSLAVVHYIVCHQKDYQELIEKLANEGTTDIKTRLANNRLGLDILVHDMNLAVQHLVREILLYETPKSEKLELAKKPGYFKYYLRHEVYEVRDTALKTLHDFPTETKLQFIDEGKYLVQLSLDPLEEVRVPAYRKLKGYEKEEELRHYIKNSPYHLRLTWARDGWYLKLLLDDRVPEVRDTAQETLDKEQEIMDDIIKSIEYMEQTHIQAHYKEDYAKQQAHIMGKKAEANTTRNSEGIIVSPMDDPWRDDVLKAETQNRVDELQNTAQIMELAPPLTVDEHDELPNMIHSLGLDYKLELVDKRLFTSILAKDPDYRVKSALIDQELELESFLDDKDNSIRWYLADFGHFLKVLVNDENQAVRERALLRMRESNE